MPTHEVLLLQLESFAWDRATSFVRSSFASCFPEHERQPHEPLPEPFACDVVGGAHHDARAGIAKVTFERASPITVSAGDVETGTRHLGRDFGRVDLEL